jgi:hypothetical protein
MSSCRSCANRETRRAKDEEAVHSVLSYRGAAIARLESASSVVVVYSSFSVPVAQVAAAQTKFTVSRRISIFEIFMYYTTNSVAGHARL